MPERKLVTVLFADIVGSTALGFERDPEVVREAVAERVAREELARIEPSGYGFDVAQLRIALGEILVSAGRTGEARDELMKARTFFADPLARGWQEKIDALLARAGAPVA